MLGRGAALLVVLYQRLISPWLGQHCRFAPSCSAYAVEALRANGLVVGSAQTLWRLARCAPWGAGGVDHPKHLGSITSRILRREVPRAQ